MEKEDLEFLQLVRQHYTVVSTKPFRLALKKSVRKNSLSNFDLSPTSARYVFLKAANSSKYLSWLEIKFRAYKIFLSHFKTHANADFAGMYLLEGIYPSHLKSLCSRFSSIFMFIEDENAENYRVEILPDSGFNFNDYEEANLSEISDQYKDVPESDLIETEYREGALNGPSTNFGRTLAKNREARENSARSEETIDWSAIERAAGIPDSN